MSISYWVTCALDPWPALESDEAFSEIIEALRSQGEYEYDAVTLTLQEAAPSFVPPGSVVLEVNGSASANWDEVMALLDAMAAAGDGVVFSEDRQVVLDRRSVRPGVKAFNERPAWAIALAAKLGTFVVEVSGPRAVADANAELARVGLRALATRCAIAALPGGFSIEATDRVDALVAGQALAYALAGRAEAVSNTGAREPLPR
jgi:hypothetical protein